MEGRGKREEIEGRDRREGIIVAASSTHSCGRLWPPGAISAFIT